MKDNRCRHPKKSIETVTKCFSGPVGHKQNPRAHGNICEVETCGKCGAVRETNINCCASETSGWYGGRSARGKRMKKLKLNIGGNKASIELSDIEIDLINKLPRNGKAEPFFNIDDEEISYNRAWQSLLKSGIVYTTTYANGMEPCALNIGLTGFGKLVQGLLAEHVEGGDLCPGCGAKEIEHNGPSTMFECGAKYYNDIRLNGCEKNT